MKLKFAVAALMAAASFGASAADQTVTVSLDAGTNFTGLATETDGLLSGGSDVITFDGLASGIYDVAITISGQGLTWNAADTTLNGVHGAYDASFGIFKFLGIAATGAESPFVLNLAGSITGSKPVYSGEINVSAVPEPSTYGMLLGGLGIMGFLARRKAKKA